jgi:exosortase
MLWPLWTHDPNLTHGVFMPVLAGILVFESRRDPAPRFASGGWAITACAAMVLAALASLAVAVVYAAALGWTVAIAEFMLSAAFVFVLGAGLVGFADKRVRFIPLNWASCVAALLWIFSSQPPPGTYMRLALFLQERVTHGVTHALGTAGIAAFQVGNVIELAHTSVGVSEACSGVRSLISCTVAGLFLSALMVRRPRNRALLVVLSPAIGLAMNFVRSLILTLVANSGIQIEGPWHDITGGSILVGTTLLVAGLGLWLSRGESAAVPLAPVGDPPRPGRSVLQGIVASGLLVGAVGMGLLGLSSHDNHRQARAAATPDLAALLPEAPPGWSAEQPSMDVYSDVLQTHTLLERVYTRGEGAAAEHVTLYLAYWRPGQAAVSLVDAHTPDACWPGTGWEAESVPSDRLQLDVSGRTLPTAECRRFARGNFKTYVWFWHLHGGHPIRYVDPYSALRLLGLAWHYGFTPPKDQLFVRVSSNRPWREVASEPTLTRFFSNLEPLGL